MCIIVCACTFFCFLPVGVVDMSFLWFYTVFLWQWLLLLLPRMGLCLHASSCVGDRTIKRFIPFEGGRALVHI